MSETLIRQLPVLVIAMPIIFAPLLALLPSKGIWKNICWLITYFVIGFMALGSLVLLFQSINNNAVIYNMGSWPPSIGIEYKITRFSAFMMLMVSAISFTMLSYASVNIRHEIPRQRIALFYACLLLCLSGLMGMAASSDIFNIFVFLEISSITTYALISLGKNKRALTAAFNYLVIGTIGGTLFLLGIGLVYAQTGSLNISYISGIIEHQGFTKLSSAGFIFMFAGLAIKSAIFPFSSWLPRAYSFAPTIISALFAAVSTKITLFVLIKIIYELFGSEFIFSTLEFGLPLSVIAVLAIIYGSIAACFQNDLRRILAFSSIANIGYMVLGIALVSEEGLTSTMTAFLSHALATGGMFIFIGIVITYYGAGKLENLAGMGGNRPLLSASFVILALSLFGMPLTVGFFSKWLLISALIENGTTMAIISLAGVIAGAICAIIYLFKMIEVIYFHEPTSEKPAIPVDGFCVFFFALLSIYFGIRATPMLNFFNTIASGLL